MVRHTLKGAMMLMLVLTMSLVARTANAQAQHTQYANIPFDFVAGDKAMSAGRYRVAQMTPSGEAISVTNVETATAAIKLTNILVRTNPAVQSKLVFHRYGNTYFLSEIWRAGENNGRMIRKSSQEKAAEQELAANRKSFDRVEVATARD